MVHWSIRLMTNIVDFMLTSNIDRCIAEQKKKYVPESPTIAYNIPSHNPCENYNRKSAISAVWVGSKG